VTYDVPSTQCAAVTTHFALMIAPPQMWLKGKIGGNILDWRDTCHGYREIVVDFPLTIFPTADKAYQNNQIIFLYDRLELSIYMYVHITSNSLFGMYCKYLQELALKSSNNNCWFIHYMIFFTFPSLSVTLGKPVSSKSGFHSTVLNKAKLCMCILSSIIFYVRSQKKFELFSM
jgi:hypothetical protein